MRLGYTANLTAEYRAALTGGPEWFLGAELLNEGDLFLTADNQEDGRVGAHSFLNARFGVQEESGRWRVMVWGKNLTDTRVRQRLFDLYDQDLIGQRYIPLNDPKMYGVSFGLRF